ncbi:MAG TPA: hypothetical protein EYG89_06050 [Bacteroidia bacterium]|nr:hypothetical protein [Bacteroidia bacterium]
MSIGDKKDWNEFNCREEYEFTYVKNLYFRPSDVYDWLQKACDSRKLNHSTHGEIYKMLKDAGFTKK